MRFTTQELAERFGIARRVETVERFLLAQGIEYTKHNKTRRMRWEIDMDKMQEAARERQQS